MDKKKILKEVKNWALMILVALFLATLLNSKVFAKVIVQQSSMENTLFHDQHLIEDEISYQFKAPQKGDIIIFYKNEDKGTIFTDIRRNVDNFITRLKKEDNEIHERLVKRVIGVAGDEVDIKDGYVYINGVKLEEPYAVGETLVGKFVLPITVGENQLFVLGDNRIVSVDSRTFGLVDLKQIEGKAVFRVFPFSEIGKLN